MRTPILGEQVNSFFAIMEFKYVGILGLVIFVFYLGMVRRPSPFGGIFALLCIYLPFSAKFPFAYGSGVNLLNAFYLTLLFLRRGMGGTDQGDTVRTMAFRWAGISVFSVVLSALLNGVDFASDQLNTLKQWLDPLIIYLLAIGLKEEADLRSVLDGVLVGTTLFAIDLTLEGTDIGEKVRVGGAMGQANTAAAFVAAYSPLVLTRCFTARRTVGRLALFVALLFCCWAEVETVSRAGMIGLGVALLVTASLSGRPAVMLTIWGLTIALLVSPVLLPDKLVSRFEGKDIKGVNQEAQASTEGRVAIWSAALSMVASNPFGVGFGAFKHQIGNYGEFVDRDAHNFYILVWAEMGLLGLLIFLGVLFQMVKRGWQTFRVGGDGLSYNVGLALVGGLMGLMVANFFSVTMREATVFGYLWLMAALAYNSMKRSQGAVAAPRHAQGSNLGVLQGRVLRAGT